MTVDDRALALIRRFEACRLKAYMPTPNDVPTIGWGSTGKDIHLGLTWTQEQADTRFAVDVRRFADGVAKAIGGAPTTTNEFGAMVSLAYNIGLGAFAKSSVLRLHRLGKHHLAAGAFGMWVKQGSVTLAGLVKRRDAEAALYRSVA